jgi:REP element-mobilizing transposase RayT
MGRSTRADHRGGIFHVIARGNNKEFIFHDNKDKGYFINILKKSCEVMGCRVYGYVLMDNHYHILIQTMDKKMQEVMHKINNMYSKYFNLKYERVGHVFQGRYKSSIIQDEFYMYNVLKYIHRNPIEAGLCMKIQDYVWSSDRYYRKQITDFVDTSLIMNMLSSNLNGTYKGYSEFMDQYDDESYEDEEPVGDEAFKTLYSSREKAIYIRKTLDEILIDTKVTIDEFNEIKVGNKKRILTQYKLIYISAARESGYTYDEISSNINISRNSAKELLNRYRKDTKI